MDGRTALITGISGQDGAYLAELLLARGYRVHGMTRQASGATAARLGRLREATPGGGGVSLHLGDLTDASSLMRVIAESRPDEVYNLGAQSHVGVSFQMPEYTLDCNALGTLRLLEAIRRLGRVAETRFYQASTSEMFGDTPVVPQDEATPFQPRSPYGVSKLAAHWHVSNYRDAYGLFACSGILFNHESPRRGESFVSRKITLGLARIDVGLQASIELGNLDARRDWGHARDYVRAQWLMLQQDAPGDYVIATGRQHSVRDFVAAAAGALGWTLRWEGEGLDERARLVSAPRTSAAQAGQCIVRLAAAHRRPNEVPDLRGDPRRARERLGWWPETGFDALVAEMVAHDLEVARREALDATMA